MYRPFLLHTYNMRIIHAVTSVSLHLLVSQNTRTTDLVNRNVLIVWGTKRSVHCGVYTRIGYVFIVSVEYTL